MITLDELLMHREARQHKRSSLIEKFNQVLISFHLNIPGNEKDKLLYKVTMIDGYRQLKDFLDDKGLLVTYEQIEFYRTGPEATFIVESEAIETKELMVEFENLHPLGRVFDLDVYDTTGLQVSRTQIGLDERRCYVCDDLAKVCARSKHHDINLIIDTIDTMMTQFHTESHREI